MDDELMKCQVCGTPRASRYAAYCHVCGSPLPELAPGPDEPADPGQPQQGWEDSAAAAGAVFASDADVSEPTGAVYPPDSYPTGSPARGAYPTGSVPGGNVPPGPGPARQDVSPVGGPGGQVRAAAGDRAPAAPGTGGGVRVYERPETPPSVVRRRRLTWIMVGIGLLVSLLLLVVGPLRGVFGARNQAGWVPPGTATAVDVIIPTLPPGVSAAQATARARYTPTAAPTWTAGVPLETAPAGGTPGGTGGGSTGGGALATVVLPTLGPAPTATLAATATPVPPTSAPATAAPTATPVPPTATLVAPTLPAPTAPVTGTVSGANLPGAISGGRVIAFVSDRSGSPQVWIAASGGGNQIQVTRDGQNTSPSWSFDNRYLYYLGQRNGKAGVYRLDITTGREESLFQDPSVVSARPLPNGQLAILRTENGRYSLYVGDRRLFQLDRSFQFQFSPDGRRVVIDPNEDPRAISVVDVASTKAKEVAPARSWNAGWGQGDRLTYVSDRTGIASVYIAGPNGEEPRAVSPGNKWSQAPAFSSDGSLIAFIGGDGAAWNVYMVGANGQNAHKVGGPANPSKSPAWQPGGGLVAYESNRAGNWDIYVTDPGGKERALTNDPGNDVDPAWTW